MTLPDCVTFDLDDTLYLEREYVRSGFLVADTWVRRELGVEGFGDRAWAAFTRGVRAVIFDTALHEAGIEPTPEIVSCLVALYRSHEPTIAMLADARRCVEQVDHLAVAVVTDGPRESQWAKARAVGADQWAQLVVVTADLGRDDLGLELAKPHPRAFEMVEEATGCRGRQCVYVADNPAKDFGGPRSLGWRTVRVRRPGSLHEVVGSGPDVEIEVGDLDGLPDLLG